MTTEQMRTEAARMIMAAHGVLAMGAANSASLTADAMIAAAKLLARNEEGGDTNHHVAMQLRPGTQRARQLPTRRLLRRVERLAAAEDGASSPQRRREVAMAVRLMFLTAEMALGSVEGQAVLADATGLARAAAIAD